MEILPAAYSIALICRCSACVQGDRPEEIYIHLRGLVLRLRGRPPLDNFERVLPDSPVDHAQTTPDDFWHA